MDKVEYVRVVIFAFIGLMGCALALYGLWNDYKHPGDRYQSWREAEDTTTHTTLGGKVL
jgi:hypothetical protein